MSGKELSKNGNIPHVAEEQANEDELLPNENVDIEEQEAELQPVEPELSVPEINEGQAELHPVDTELLPTKHGEAEGQEAELHPVEAKLSLPENKAAVKKEKPIFHPIEALLRLPRDHDISEAEFRIPESMLFPTENDKPGGSERKAKSSLPKNKSGTERERPKFHPIEAILRRPRSDDGEDAEEHNLDFRQITTDSKDSDRGSSLEGAVGGVKECSCHEQNFSQCGPILSGKEDLFRKFFSDEYDLPNAPILGRQRHSAEVQRPRHRHASEDSKLSDQNPLGCLQDAGTSGGVVFNQAGAMIGKYIPTEDIPDYARFGTEFGQSLPPIARNEGSEHSIGSMSTAPIGEVYGGTFSVISDLSYDSEEFGQRIPYLSLLSRPQTATSDKSEISPPDSNLPEDNEQLPVTADSKDIVHRKPGQPRRDVTEPARSKSALAGLSAYASELQDSNLEQRKLSKAMSVRSEPLPQRKMSPESSINSSEKMSLEDETNYAELAHSLESDSDVPGADIEPAFVSLEPNLGASKISDAESADVMKDVALEQTEAGEPYPETINIEHNAVVQNVSSVEVTEASESAEQDPETVTSCSPEAGTSE